MQQLNEKSVAYLVLKYDGDCYLLLEWVYVTLPSDKRTYINYCRILL